MPPLVALTSVHGAFAAHVLAARLRSEGIDVELRGALGGPYALTVGDMARVDVFVPAEQATDAQLVLLAAEVDDAMVVGPDELDGPDGSDERDGSHDWLHDGASAPRGSTRPAAWPWVASLLLIAAAVAAPVLRYLTD